MGKEVAPPAVDDSEKYSADWLSEEASASVTLPPPLSLRMV